MRGMKRGLCHCAGSAGVVLAALFIVFTSAFAQNPAPAAQTGGRPIAGGFDKVHELPPGGPAPRMADGHPDLSGTWYPNAAGRQLESAYPVDQAAFRQFDPKVTPEEKPSFKPETAAKYNRPLPYGECEPAGIPSVITGQATHHTPLELIQTPGRLVILVEYPRDFIIIRTDGRPHPKDPDPTFNGDSVARWEGDTLVIDTIAIDERERNVLWGEEQGWLHSDQEHVVERFNRPSKNYLIYQVTIEDPMVLAKPWTSAPRKWSLAQDPNDGLQEYVCTHNEEPSDIKKINAAKAKGK